MIEVRVGNDQAKEGYRDPKSDNPDLVRYRAYEGQHTTTLLLPDETPLNEAFVTVVGTMRLHMEDQGIPKWVESDWEALTVLLKDHYGITKGKPRNWGKKATTKKDSEE